MTKMTIYRFDVHADYLVPVTAKIDLRYPLAGYVHVGRYFWTVIDLETGLSYDRPVATLKECGPIVAKLYDKVQEIKRHQKYGKSRQLRVEAVRKMIEDDNNIELYNHLDKYGEVFNK